MADRFAWHCLPRAELPNGLRKALLLSLTAHALIVFGLDRIALQMASSSARAAPLRVVIAATAPVSSAAAVPAPAPVAARHAAPVPRPSLPDQVRVAPAAASARATGEPPRPLETVVVAGAPSDSPVSAELPAPVGIAESAATSIADPDLIRQYRLALALQAKRHKRFPALASERGWSGTVQVALSVRSGSLPPEVALDKSSGFPVLDDAALEMIRRASIATSIPAGLQHSALRLVIPVTFDIED